MTRPAPTRATVAALVGAGATVTAGSTFTFGDDDLTDMHSIVDDNGTIAGTTALASIVNNALWVRNAGGNVNLTTAQVDAIGSLTATVSDDTLGDGTGTVSWTYTTKEGALDFLAQGETLTLTYRVTVQGRLWLQQRHGDQGRHGGHHRGQ